MRAIFRSVLWLVVLVSSAATSQATVMFFFEGKNKVFAEFMPSLLAEHRREPVYYRPVDENTGFVIWSSCGGGVRGFCKVNQGNSSLVPGVWYGMSRPKIEELADAICLEWHVYSACSRF